MAPLCTRNRVVASLHSQRGQALIMLIVLLSLAGATVFYTLYNPSAQPKQWDQATAFAMTQARDALIGRAASDADRPGSLPCPDTDNDGQENWDVAGTACISYIGRLPWATLGLPDLRDASGERFWYAVSPNFRDHAAVSPLNSDSAEQLTITGMSPASNVVAIIFTPGQLRAGQVRDAGNQNNVANYLEGENNNGDFIFTTASTSDTFNDRLFAVTSDALFATVTTRVAREVQLALEQYRTTNGYYPYANDYADGSPYVCKDALRDGRVPLVIQTGCPAIAEWAGPLPAWFSANNWNTVTHYGMDNTCALTVTGVTTTGCTVVLVTGRALGSQTRPCASASQCLEDAENTNGDSVYVKPSPYPTSNDRMVVR